MQLKPSWTQQLKTQDDRVKQHPHKFGPVWILVDSRGAADGLECPGLCLPDLLELFEDLGPYWCWAVWDNVTTSGTVCSLQFLNFPAYFVELCSDMGLSSRSVSKEVWYYQRPWQRGLQYRLTLYTLSLPSLYLFLYAPSMQSTSDAQLCPKYLAYLQKHCQVSHSTNFFCEYISHRWHWCCWGWLGVVSTK